MYVRDSCFKPSEFRGYIHVMAAFKHAWLIKFWAPIPAVIAAGFSPLTILALLAPFGLSRVNYPLGRSAPAAVWRPC